MTLTRQLHLIWYAVLTLTLVQLGIIVWVAVDALRRRGARWSATDRPAADPSATTDDLLPALRDDPELGPVMAVRLGVGDGPLQEVGIISQGDDFTHDLGMLMTALAIEFETIHAERFDKGGPVTNGG